MQSKFGPFTLIYYILPSLILLSPLSWNRLLRQQNYRQTFGSDSIYLDLKLEPASYAKNKNKQAFEGTIATSDYEEPVNGYRMKSNGYTWYVFESKKGQFIGWLMNGKKGCEPELHYQMQTGTLKANNGVLRAAFCL